MTGNGENGASRAIGTLQDITETKLVEKVKKPSYCSSMELTAFLYEWLQNHILGYDQKLGVFFNSLEKEFLSIETASPETAQYTEKEKEGIFFKMARIETISEKFRKGNPNAPKMLNDILKEFLVSS